MRLILLISRKIVAIIIYRVFAPVNLIDLFESKFTILIEISFNPLEI